MKIDLLEIAEAIVAGVWGALVVLALGAMIYGLVGAFGKIVASLFLFVAIMLAILSFFYVRNQQ